MSRSKKTRRITDIMPARKVDKPFEQPRSRPSKQRKLTRYELDLQAREEKRKRKHKGLPSGSRVHEGNPQKEEAEKAQKDPRIGSRKKVPLIVEFVNKPNGRPMSSPVSDKVSIKSPLPPEVELEQLENNECLNQLLDELEAGKTLSSKDQQFVDECLDRIAQLMSELGIRDEDDEGEELLRQFETLDINQFR